MNKIACQYAIVRFTPFIETGEFANVGIVMISPKLDFFDFRLQTKRYARITRFFDDIDATVYKKTLQHFKAEMNRVADMFALEAHNPALTQNLFSEITRPRETIVRFSQVRTVLTDNPEQQLDKLFAYYVERNFVTKKYKEVLLENDIRKLLNNANLGNKFSREQVGDEAYHVAFPFVQQIKNRPEKIIKPLHLGHDEPTKIYDHGAAWVVKVKKLQAKKVLLAEKMLFTLAAPDTDTGNRFEAYKEIEHDLLQTGIQVVPFLQNKSNQQIIEFAHNVKH